MEEQLALEQRVWQRVRGLRSPEQDLEEALESLIRDMAAGKQKLADEAKKVKGGPLGEDHPLMKGLKAIQEAAEKMRGSALS